VGLSQKGLMELLVPVARRAGAAIVEVHRKAAAKTKADGSPVTEADLAAEAIILAALKEVTPNIPVVSEENAASHAGAASKIFWLVDPLDGTKEFLKADGKGAFTVNLALIENGFPVLGIVFAPALDRMFWGARGIGAHEENAGGARDIKVRAVPADGPVAVASASHRDTATDNWLKANRIGRTVSIGSSLKFCLIAAGEADVYPRFGPTMEWDTAAGDAVLRAAGGVTLDPAGKSFVYGKAGYRNGGFIACGHWRPKIA
jgi:3'(2'), 5'-bisphosphate nucleotidase